MAAKTLSQLGLSSRNGHDPEITEITVDSRQVKPGTLFAALPGSRVHGAEFIQYALRQDASAILTDNTGAEFAADVLKASDIALVIVDDPRQALAYAAALFYGQQPRKIIAVTGTNGKTSVASFCRQMWMDLGRKAVNLGTTGIEGAWSFPLAHTTPEPITLHNALAQADASGVTHVAMEASSHGLAQRRLDGVKLSAAGFTNFTQDHLDYHETFEDYFKAKEGLFSRLLPPGKTAVFNIDDPKVGQYARDFSARHAPVITVGKAKEADLRIVSQRYNAAGQDIRFSWAGECLQVSVPLVGGFQGENLALAMAILIGSGETAGDVFRAAAGVVSVRGRMELAATRQNGATVFVDYAHTPDAVAAALQALRPHTMGRIIVVFGAGGDRDPGKRLLMGQAAAEFADVQFVTDDNPRSEDPANIREMVMAGVPNATEVGDRAEAILRAVDSAGAGDTILIAGKGHETGQQVGEVVLPFDDVEQASISVAALEGNI